MRLTNFSVRRGVEIFGIAPCACWLFLARAPERPGIPSVFAPESTPAKQILGNAILVLVITGAIFVIVATLLIYAIAKFRMRSADNGKEPVQIYGSDQIELAWTVTPILIVVFLFLATARVLESVENAKEPSTAMDVTVVGHQFWWEFRYPKFGIVTANELHVPVSTPENPSPTFLTLLSADTDHSFWVPRLAGKTDLIPNRVNTMWIDPRRTGLYVGQCAQYCGTQHAKMLLRVYVDSKDAFAAWVQQQKSIAAATSRISEGQKLFETTACINCHTIRGTAATGRFGPDLTHLMSRETLAAGAIENTPRNLREWIEDPDAIKPGSLMPAMKLSDKDLDALTSYLETLH